MVDKLYPYQKHIIKALAGGAKFVFLDEALVRKAQREGISRWYLQYREYYTGLSVSEPSADPAPIAQKE